MNGIDRQRRIDPTRLDPGRYLESLLREATRTGLLPPAEGEYLQSQLLILLAQESDAYQLGESSSIRVELADTLLQSINFLLGLACKAQPGPEEAVDLLRNTPLSNVHAQGRKLLRGKLHYAAYLYRRVRAGRTLVPLRAYHDTLKLEEGIGDFFRHYDTRFGAHEIPGTIDYPLCLPAEGLQGVEYIMQYLRHLQLENQFCISFSDDAIHHLLLGYSSRYPDLLINIFRHTYIGALCCALYHRPIRELVFTRVEADALQAAFAQQPDAVRPALLEADARLKQALDLQPGDLQKYLQRCLTGIIDEVQAFAKSGAPNPLFSPPVLPTL